MEGPVNGGFSVGRRDHECTRDFSQRTLFPQLPTLRLDRVKAHPTNARKHTKGAAPVSSHAPHRWRPPEGHPGGKTGEPWAEAVPRSSGSRRLHDSGGSIAKPSGADTPSRHIAAHSSSAHHADAGDSASGRKLLGRRLAACGCLGGSCWCAASAPGISSAGLNFSRVASSIIPTPVVADLGILKLPRRPSD